MTWSAAPAPSRSATALRGPASASSSSPECRCALPAPPTCCASPLSARTATRICERRRRCIFPPSNQSARRSHSEQRRIQRDPGIQQLRYRASGLGHRRQLLEFRLVRARNFCTQGEVHRGDGKTLALLFQRDVSLGLHLFGGELGFAEDQGQRHGKTGGMRGADQFLRVGARLALEAAGEAVRIILERAALGRNRALAVPDTALPFGRSGSRWHIFLLTLSVGCTSHWPVVASKRWLRWDLFYAPTSVLAGSTACTTRPRARASITPTARSASSVTVCTASRSRAGSSRLSGANGPTSDSCSAPSSAVAASTVSCAGRCPARTAASIRVPISPAISRRLASLDAVTSTSTGSGRGPQASLRCDSNCTATGVTAAASADDGPGAASAARRIAVSSSRETSAISSEIRSALEGK